MGHRKLYKPETGYLLVKGPIEIFYKPKPEIFSAKRVT
ncbi:hypothetical protein SAMD00020551_2356 [Mesobacillus selenatarsenatis SF-1]|uniref:Uncharacterized protein n=1 Tax=Mesobacillus selenatarsenatis (strain DSM 18680 / JCM 14380 / FERM P-15431 / SF-1) TaxID=1321606 RepID=A0A0A8X2N8_MESS1|nr:hypothetical protein SAMD00020551_2356 [Mesobacillus selenatarsenatis SF-1]